MRQFLLIFSLVVILCPVLKSQNIDFKALGKENKSYVYVIYNGLKQDTIARGVIDEDAKGRIILPAKYHSVLGMGRLIIEDERGIDLIVSGGNFSFELLAENKLVFYNSLENDLLHHRQSEAISDVYKDTYAHFYFKTLNIVMKMAQFVNNKGKSDFFEQSRVRIDALNNVDVDKLYYSQFWFFFIDGMMRLSIGEEGFAKDMIRLLDKVKTDEVYIAFVKDLITITNQYGMEDAFDVIIPSVMESGRIVYPQGIIFDAFTMAKVRRGMIAPDVKGLKSPLGITQHKLTMIVFHEPGCDNCREQMEYLKNNYAFFEQKGVRIIAISGSCEEDVTNKTDYSYPWLEELCDSEGIAGVNFQNYGVVATPTIYLIDGESVVLKRFARIVDVEVFIRGCL